MDGRRADALRAGAVLLGALAQIAGSPLGSALADPPGRLRLLDLGADLRRGAGLGGLPGPPRAAGPRGAPGDRLATGRGLRRERRLGAALPAGRGPRAGPPRGAALRD